MYDGKNVLDRNCNLTFNRINQFLFAMIYLQSFGNEVFGRSIMLENLIFHLFPIDWPGFFSHGHGLKKPFMAC